MADLVRLKIAGLNVSNISQRGLDALATEFAENLAVQAHAEWVRLAGVRLRSGAIDYENGIQTPEVERGRVTIRLTGFLPVALELGYDPFDMKAKLLSGAGSKPLKEGTGRYATVPFRHGTPKSSGRRFPRMPGAVHRQAQKLVATEQVGGSMVWGGRLGGTEVMFEPKVKEQIGAMTAPYTHVSGKYEGMVRAAKMYRARTQTGGFYTMRRVSTSRTENNKQKGSDPNSWIHPGFKAVNLIPEVQAYVKAIAGSVAQSMGLATA